MNSNTQYLFLAGPVGQLQVAIDEPAQGLTPVGVAVICHPHPLHGGTMQNKVVQTLARACTQKGWRSIRFNYRGVDQSEGTWDQGYGETDDALAVMDAFQQSDLPFALAGFSFGGHVAARATEARSQSAAHGNKCIDRLLLVGPATVNFAVPSVPEHTVVIHGEADEVVPLSGTMNWARPQNLPVIVVPGVGHFFHGQLPLLKSLAMRWWI